MDLDLLVPVLQHLQLLPPVEQVEQFATVDFEEGNVELRRFVSVLSLGQCEQVGYGCFVTAFHGECFAGTSLSVSETGDDAFVEGEVDAGLNGGSVERVGGLLAGEGVVELEVMVVDVASDAVHSVFALVHSYPRVGSTHCVHFACLFFLGEDGSFPDAHRYLHVGCGLVGGGVLAAQFVLLHHQVELMVHVASARCFIQHLSGLFARFLFLHHSPPFLTLTLHTLNVLQYCRLFRCRLLLLLRLLLKFFLVLHHFIIAERLFDSVDSCMEYLWLYILP